MLTKENGFELPLKWTFPDANKYAFAFISLFVILIIIYSNSFQGAFQFDDIPNIVENQNIQINNLDFDSLKQALYDHNGKLNRPLAYFSFGINYYFSEFDLFGFHLVNFIIHYLTAIFLFLFIFKTLHLPIFKNEYTVNAYNIALLSAVFWAISPMHVTAVTYIVQRMASMAGLFYIISMYFYLLGRTEPMRGRQIWFFAVTLFCALLSFASKQNAIMLPVSIVLYDLLLIQGVNKSFTKRNLVIAGLPLIFLALLLFWRLDFSAILGSYEGRSFTLAERLLTQPRILFFYISQLLYPLESQLTLLHDISVSKGLFSPITTILSILGIAGAITFALARSAKYPLLAFAILFFFINHAIEGSFIPLELIYEHRNYIPSFFFFVPIAIFIIHILSYFSSRKIIQIAIVILLAVVWIGQGHTVYKRNGLFTNPLAFWIDNTLKAPGLSRVHTNLGTSYQQQGFYEKAYKHYLIAEKLGTYNNIHNQAMNLYNLGGYYLYVGAHPELAHEYFEKSLRIFPSYWQSWHYLILSKIIIGRVGEAEKLASKMKERFPQNDYFKYVLGLCYLKQNKLEECKEISRISIKQTSQPEVFFNLLGAVYFYEHDYTRALKYWNMVLLNEPKNRDVLLGLTEIYHRMSMKDQRNKTVETMLCLKENKTWNEYIAEAAQNNASNPYIVKISKLMPIIADSLKDVEH